MNVIHPDDQATIERLHTDVTNKINDQLLTFQDDSYALGHARGVKDGEALRERINVLERHLSRAVEICREQGRHWDSDDLIAGRNYADHCADLIEAAVKGGAA